MLTYLSTVTETANRHLEDLDILFASESPLVWRAERDFAQRAKRGGGGGALGQIEKDIEQ
jgi:hypothetical protein